MAETNSRVYVLGNSSSEQSRLKLQASIVARWTESYLLAAGLERGMHVLDIGTGMGDVALLAAEIVGPSGSVTAIDRDPVVVEKATARAAEQGHSAPVRIIHSDVMQFQADRPFDAVVGRYVMLYQPDAPACLRHLNSLLRQGGILCFHEMAFGSPMPSFPEETLLSKMVVFIGELFRRSGINPDMGLVLAKAFADADLPRPILKADIPIGGEAGSYLYGWAAETVRSLLPRIEQLGLATAAELDVETLAQRIEDEAVSHPSQLLGPIQFGAWLRKP